MARDTVFNSQMQVVFSNEPDVVHRRLSLGYSEDWVAVCIGETRQIVTLPEYIYREKYDMVVKTLKELLDKKDLPMYRRDPARLDAHIERVATSLIKRILQEGPR